MTAVQRRAYLGAATPTTIVSGIDTTATTCTLVDATGWPTGYPFYVMLDAELLSSQEKCVATRSGVTLTLTRHADETTAKVHAAGASIKPIFSAVEADEANAMAALITTRGDVITGGTSGTPQRVALGTTGNVLTSDGTDAVWATPATQTTADGSITDVKHAPRTINIKTADYTFALGDETEVFQFNNTSLTATVPPAATAAFAAGTQIEVENIHSTALTVAAGAGVTILNAGGLTLAQYQSGVLRLTATANTWLFFQRGGIGYGTATGGDSSATITVSGQNYTMLTFLNSGNVTVTTAGWFDVLLIGAGGGGAGGTGAGSTGGGGGGGDVVGLDEMVTVYLTVGTHAVVIGAGGTGFAFNIAPSSAVGNKTTFAGLVAVGGGGGGSLSERTDATGQPYKVPSGGSSGGGSACEVRAWGRGRLGNDGGTGSAVMSTPTGASNSGGGGGSASAGGNGSGTTGGTGGNGTDISAWITGAAYYAGAGAGGGGSTVGGTAGNGGVAGKTSGTGNNGVNYGAGGGGTCNATGGNGAKGAAFIRFQI